MRLLTPQTEFVPLDYKSFVAHIREVGVHEPRADHHDRHLGLPVFAKFYRMPDGTPSLASRNGTGKKSSSPFRPINLTNFSRRKATT